MQQMTVSQRADQWFELFSLHAADLYPGRYTREYVDQLAVLAEEILVRKAQKRSLIVAHYYVYPELQEIADHVGDSLGLSKTIESAAASRVDFNGVYFMGETAKIISPKTRVYMQSDENELGCSLVFGTDIAWLLNWKAKNPGGLIVTYINSSAKVKAVSDYICTSRNATAVLLHAIKNNPGKPILLAPDQFLGHVMKTQAKLKAHEAGISAETIDQLVIVYNHKHEGHNACCYVHEEIGVSDGINEALDEHPDAELLLHPECGCMVDCLFKMERGEIPHGKAFIHSTQGMIAHALRSSAQEFVVGTELGMIYQLRKQVPTKKFFPIDANATCKYMKGNTLQGLLHSLTHDRREITLTASGIPHMRAGEANSEGAVKLSDAKLAKIAIDRMLKIG